MDYTHLGRTGLKVSRYVLGCWNFGWVTEEPASHAMMDRAIDLGINFFDTANVYGGDNVGMSETIVGNWFTNTGRRDKVVLATKLYGRMGDWPNESRLSAFHIRRACEASLQRMKTDHIDLYQMHHVDRNTPWDEIWQAMEVLVRQGKISYVGSSNFAGWDIATACEMARQRHFVGLVSEQSVYNLCKRDIELEVIPSCQYHGLGIIPWSPLWGGILGGALRKSGDGRRSRESVQQRIEKLKPQLERYETLCAEVGHDPAIVAMAWLLHQPGVTAPIIGPRTMEQFDDLLPALEVKLDEQTMKTLDDIWPGPGGSAPEAYAW